MPSTFTLFNNRLTLDATPPRPSEDALWLAASYTPPAKARVLDAMGGSGIVGLALLTRCPTLAITSLDINPALTVQAAHNATLNNLPLTTVTAELEAYTPPHLFDAAFLNPPYHATAHGHATPNSAKAQAHSLPPHHLTIWLTALHTLTTPTATLALITHSACQPEILAFAQSHSYTTTFTPLATKPDTAPKRLLTLLTKSSIHTATHNQPLPAYSLPLRHHVLHHGKSLPQEAFIPQPS